MDVYFPFTFASFIQVVYITPPYEVTKRTKEGRILFNSQVYLLKGPYILILNLRLSNSHGRRISNRKLGEQSHGREIPIE